MKSKILSTTVFTLTSFLIIGCGDTNTTQLSLDTKAFEQDGSQLTIRIEDAEQNTVEDSNSSDANQNIPQTNKAPVASITTVIDGNENNETFIDIHVGTPVLFSGETSSDSDGNITTYIWTDMDNNILSSDINFTRTFYAPGVYEKTLTVIDDDGEYSQSHICILADYDKNDIPLIAYTTPNMIVTEGTPVPLSGHAVCKTGNFSYEWSENGEVLSNEQNTELIFETGEHDVLLTITDNDTGMKAYKIVKITVNPAATQD